MLVAFPVFFFSGDIQLLMRQLPRSLTDFV